MLAALCVGFYEHSLTKQGSVDRRYEKYFESLFSKHKWC